MNSLYGSIVSWLCFVVGINTYDVAFELAAAEGVTTSLILPGSINAIGGEAYVIKPMQTNERSPTSLLVEPPMRVSAVEYLPSNPTIATRWVELYFHAEVI